MFGGAVSSGSAFEERLMEPVAPGDDPSLVQAKHHHQRHAWFQVQTQYGQYTDNVLKCKRTLYGDCTEAVWKRERTMYGDRAEMCTETVQISGNGTDTVRTMYGQFTDIVRNMHRHFT